MSFITRVITFCEAWTILSKTYATPSCGHIKQVKKHLKNPTKGSQSLIEFFQHVKSRVDELAILRAPTYGKKTSLRKFFMVSMMNTNKLFELCKPMKL